VRRSLPADQLKDGRGGALPRSWAFRGHLTAARSGTAVAEVKAVAIGLMILGIAIFGLDSATLASHFIESDAKDENEDVTGNADPV
jgi:hypothetical protein